MFVYYIKDFKTFIYNEILLDVTRFDEISLTKKIKQIYATKI